MFKSESNVTVNGPVTKVKAFDQVFPLKFNEAAAFTVNPLAPAIVIVADKVTLPDTVIPFVIVIVPA